MSPPPPSPLPALPAPGITLHSPHYIAHDPTLLHLKESSGNWSNKYAVTITQQGAPYLEAREEQRREMVFRTTAGEEVLRVVKQVHKWCGRGEEYHGMRPDGSEAWHVKLHRRLTGTDYRLTIFPTPYDEQTMLVQNKVLEQEKGILWNGYVAATMSMHEKWKHMHREDILNIAPGMDILLALGVCYVRYDKQQTDAKTAAAST
ncbi:hypothetical protein BU23DRAFT_541632 [Bimuria novae-zelandiae CBS 107.79]|uniref:Tubby C-terminal domain-containing protein n=1 Tax=Bimuria novae-zelandiae CBS 107.79 TaxID=1447943 RepID=A0A6A5UTQ2_9PLEO|nr:hypothetical protein BU23DRAFT_541632 [Bimuria novae-zelandiae CBS 107.79]